MRMTAEEKAARKAQRDADHKAWLQENHIHTFEYDEESGEFKCNECGMEVSEDYAEGFEEGANRGYREGRGG